MSRKALSLERLEVRLRPTHPAEKELIEALETQSGLYGSKTELMRDCLRRGYIALQRQVENLSEAGSEVAALDALAQTFASGQYGYRVIKTYLEAKATGNSSVPQASAAPPAPPATVEPLAVPLAPQTTDEGTGDASGPKSGPNWSRFRGVAGVDS